MKADVQFLEYVFKNKQTKLAMLACNCNPSLLKAETGGCLGLAFLRMFLL